MGLTRENGAVYALNGTGEKGVEYIANNNRGYEWGYLSEKAVDALWDHFAPAFEYDGPKPMVISGTSPNFVVKNSLDDRGEGSAGGSLREHLQRQNAIQGATSQLYLFNNQNSHWTALLVQQTAEGVVDVIYLESDTTRGSDEASIPVGLKTALQVVYGNDIRYHSVNHPKQQRNNACGMHACLNALSLAIVAQERSEDTISALEDILAVDTPVDTWHQNAVGFLYGNAGYEGIVGSDACKIFAAHVEREQQQKPDLASAQQATNKLTEIKRAFFDELTGLFSEGRATYATASDLLDRPSVQRNLTKIYNEQLSGGAEQSDAGFKNQIKSLLIRHINGNGYDDISQGAVDSIFRLPNITGEAETAYRQVKENILNVIAGTIRVVPAPRGVAGNPPVGDLASYDSSKQQAKNKAIGDFLREMQFLRTNNREGLLDAVESGELYSALGNFYDDYGLGTQSVEGNKKRDAFISKLSAAIAGNYQGDYTKKIALQHINEIFDSFGDPKGVYDSFYDVIKNGLVKTVKSAIEGAQGKVYSSTPALSMRAIYRDREALLGSRSLSYDEETLDYLNGIQFPYDGRREPLNNDKNPLRATADSLFPAKEGNGDKHFVDSTPPVLDISKLGNKSLPSSPERQPRGASPDRRKSHTDIPQPLQSPEASALINAIYPLGDAYRKAKDGEAYKRYDSALAGALQEIFTEYHIAEERREHFEKCVRIILTIDSSKNSENAQYILDSVVPSERYEALQASLVTAIKVANQTLVPATPEPAAGTMPGKSSAIPPANPAEPVAGEDPELERKKEAFFEALYNAAAVYRQCTDETARQGYREALGKSLQGIYRKYNVAVEMRTRFQQGVGAFFAADRDGIEEKHIKFIRDYHVKHVFASVAPEAIDNGGLQNDLVAAMKAANTVLVPVRVEIPVEEEREHSDYGNPFPEEGMSDRSSFSGSAEGEEVPRSGKGLLTSIMSRLSRIIPQRMRAPITPYGTEEEQETEVPNPLIGTVLPRDVSDTDSNPETDHSSPEGSVHGDDDGSVSTSISRSLSVSSRARSASNASTDTEDSLNIVINTLSKVSVPPSTGATPTPLPTATIITASEKDAAFTKAVLYIDHSKALNSSEQKVIGLVKNFIETQNNPANTKPHEYAGIGVETIGCLVKKTIIGNGIKQGDKITAVYIDAGMLGALGLRSNDPAVALEGSSYRVNLESLQQALGSDKIEHIMSQTLRGLPNTQVKIDITRADGTLVKNHIISRSLIHEQESGDLATFSKISEVAKPSAALQHLTRNIEAELRAGKSATR